MNKTVSYSKPLPEHDQDAPPVITDRYGIICDGLGGNGSAMHQTEDGDRASAYLGSRFVSEACEEFFNSHYDALTVKGDLSVYIEILKQRIQEKLDAEFKKHPFANELMGADVFPTTLASFVYKELDDRILVTAIWAGDSRVYAYTKDNYLQQLTEDDVHGEFDACFGKDCRMSNCISQKNPFFINYKQYELPKECIIFACSDGCFDRAKSPIHFEYHITQPFVFDFTDKAVSDREFENAFTTMGIGDDITLSGAVFNLMPEDVKNVFYPRYQYLKEAIKQFDDNPATITAEVRSEFQRLSAAEKELRFQIPEKISAVIEDAYKNHAFGNPGLSDLFEHCKKYPPFAEYTANESRVSRENEALKAEYNRAVESLIPLVKELIATKRSKKELEEQLDSLIKTADLESFFVYDQWEKPILDRKYNPVVEVDIDMDEIAYLVQLVVFLLNGNKTNQYAIQKGFLASKNIAEKFMNMAKQFSAIRGIFEKYLTQSAPNPYSVSDAEALRKIENILCPSQHRDVIYDEFSRYIPNKYQIFDAKFKKLIDCYNNCRAKGLLNGFIYPLAEIRPETFVKKFETEFLLTHKSALIEHMRKYEFIGDYVSEIKELEQVQARISEIRRASMYSDVQKQVWEEYRRVYEGYKAPPGVSQPYTPTSAPAPTTNTSGINSQDQFDKETTPISDTPTTNPIETSSNTASKGPLVDDVSKKDDINDKADETQKKPPEDDTSSVFHFEATETAVSEDDTDDTGDEASGDAPTDADAPPGEQSAVAGDDVGKSKTDGKTTRFTIPEGHSSHGSIPSEQQEPDVHGHEMPPPDENQQASGTDITTQNNLDNLNNKL